jgi:hydrogenase/urease accessory protein HupE
MGNGKGATVRPGVVSVLFVLVVLFLAKRADAHAIGLSTGEYSAKGTTVEGRLVFARGEVAQLAPALDADGDGHVSAAEVASSRSLIATKVLERVEVTASGARCPSTIVDAALTEQDGLLIAGRWACRDAALFRVNVALLDDLARGHRHLARVGTHDELLYGDARTFEIGAADAPSTPDASTSPTSSPRRSGWLSFFVMGIEHILTGYDHLVFLFGLVLARARVRSLLAVVTAFTVAHSNTLAVAALGVWTPSSRVVEPAIALSIAYVGIENFFVKDASKRWRITFPFGLIHGFGFAGALQEIALPRADVPAALVSFNVGVETGQLVALALVLPPLMLLRDKSWFEPRAVRVLSGAIAVLGGIWFLTRALGV